MYIVVCLLHVRIHVCVCVYVYACVCVCVCVCVHFPLSFQPKPFMVKTDSTEDSMLGGFGGASGHVTFTTGDGKLLCNVLKIFHTRGDIILSYSHSVACLYIL